MTAPEVYRSIFEQGLASRMDSQETFSQLPEAVPRYLYYFWDTYWLTGEHTWTDFTRVWNEAMRHGWDLQKLHKREMTESLHLASRLASQGVPYVQEYAEWLLANSLRDENPHQLLILLFGQLHKANGSTIPRIMEAISYLLLNRLVLHAGHRTYRLTDVEFYYRRAPHHIDPYVHGGPEQEQSGTWFYNLAGGLDLTCGDHEQKAVGGILLRGLQRLDTGEYVTGIQLVLRELVAALGVAWENGPGWKLSVPERPVDFPVWRIARQGLVAKDDPNVMEYYQRPYRFLADPEYLRGLPGKEKLVYQLLETQQVGGDEVPGLVGYKPGWLA